MTTFKQVMEFFRKDAALKAWARERGATWNQVMKIPCGSWNDVIDGKSLLILRRDPECCAQCGRRHVQIGTTKPTKQPLEKIFSPTKKHK